MRKTKKMIDPDEIDETKDEQDAEAEVEEEKVDADAALEDAEETEEAVSVEKSDVVDLLCPLRGVSIFPEYGPSF